MIIGGAYGWIEYKNWAKLSLLYIDEEHRGLNIGIKLVNRVKD